LEKLLFIPVLRQDYKPKPPVPLSTNPEVLGITVQLAKVNNPRLNQMICNRLGRRVMSIITKTNQPQIAKQYTNLSVFSLQGLQHRAANTNCVDEETGCIKFSWDTSRKKYIPSATGSIFPQHSNCIFLVNALFITDTLELRRKLWYFFFQNCLVFNISQDLDNFFDKVCQGCYSNDAISLDAHEEEGGTTVFNCEYRAKVLGKGSHSEGLGSFAQPTVEEMRSVKCLKTSKEGIEYLAMTPKYEIFEQNRVRSQLILEKQHKQIELHKKLDDNLCERIALAEKQKLLNLKLSKIK